MPAFSGVMSGIIGDTSDIDGGRTVAEGGSGMTIAVDGSSKDSFGKSGTACAFPFSCEAATAAAMAANAGLALAARASAGFAFAAKANAGFEANKCPKRFAGLSAKIRAAGAQSLP